MAKLVRSMLAGEAGELMGHHFTTLVGRGFGCQGQGRNRKQGKIWSSCLRLFLCCDESH